MSVWELIKRKKPSPCHASEQQRLLGLKEKKKEFSNIWISNILINAALP